jgi:hypothetical protein
MHEEAIEGIGLDLFMKHQYPRPLSTKFAAKTPANKRA